MILIMKELNLKKEYCKIEKQNNIWINVFCYENGLTYPVYLSDQKFRDSMDLLVKSDENKSHYMYIKDFNRFMCNKTKIKIKNIFANIVYSVLVVDRTQRKLLRNKWKTKCKIKKWFNWL